MTTMQIITNLEQEKLDKRPCVIAMGTFDGLHRGHLDVIRSAAGYAKALDLQLAVFTFSNHPYACILPDHVPPALITQEEKMLLLEELGVDLLIDIPFDWKLASLKADEFLENLEKFDYRCLACGENFTYGYCGLGDTHTLKEAGEEKGFDVIVRPLLTLEGTVISSTAIRTAIAEGRLEEAAEMLGRPYSVEGVVQQGFKRGRKLGFPTANLYVDRKKSALPPPGVYAMRVQDGDTFYDGVGNLGINPTFDDVPYEVLEVHLFDCDRDLYGLHLKTTFCRFLRPEAKFGSLEELVAWIGQDKEEALDYFRKE